MILRHPGFTDVYMIVEKRFYVKEKKTHKLKVIWMHRRGYELAKERLTISADKYKEFTKERL